MRMRAAVSGPAEQRSGSWPMLAVRHVAALLAVGSAVAILEARVLELDHGTHLLVALTLVIGLALLLGPGPATTGFAAGGALAAGASVLSVQEVLGTPHVYIELLSYVLAGTAALVLVTLALRSSRRPVERPTTPVLGDGPRPSPAEALTAREIEVLRLAASGVSVEAIAERLFISPNTAKTHLSHIYAKLGVRGRTDAVRAALHCGCLTTADICPHCSASGSEESPVPVTADHRNR